MLARTDGQTKAMPVDVLDVILPPASGRAAGRTHAILAVIQINLLHYRRWLSVGRDVPHDSTAGVEDGSGDDKPIQAHFFEFTWAMPASTGCPRPSIGDAVRTASAVLVGAYLRSVTLS
jgi:hypothetical protein